MKDSIIGYERVKLSDISPHPKNPRRGNIEAIKNSLSVNGQYKPIVVNSRTRRILAGNHTYQAAKELGWDKIEVAWVGVSDEEELRIMLADNKTSDMALYDGSELARVIDEISETEMGILGTGFEDDKLTELLPQVGDPSEALKGEHGSSGRVKITLSVDKDEEEILRDRLMSLAFEIQSLKIR